jgi:hypothetical protein
MIEPQQGRSNGLSVKHAAGVAVVAVIGAVVAIWLFMWIVGAVFRVVEIAVVVAAIYLLVRWLMRRS